MRFVAVKTVEQQAVFMLKSRDLMCGNGSCSLTLCATVDGAAPEAQAREDRAGRARQQNSADRLGGDVAQGSLRSPNRVTIIRGRITSGGRMA